MKPLPPGGVAALIRVFRSAGTIAISAPTDRNAVKVLITGSYVLGRVRGINVRGIRM